MTNPFDDKTQEPNPDQALADLLGAIKNDNGEPKYADVQAALKALKESQEFIPTLLQEKKDIEARLAEREAELSKRQTLEELTEALKSKRAPEGTPATPAVAPKGIASEDIDALLESKLVAREQASQQKTNLDSVVSAVVSKHGDKANEHIKTIAEQLNTTPEKLKQLAAENPALALRLLDTQGSSQPPKTSTSTINAPRVIQDDNKLPVYARSAARGGMSNDELVARWHEVGAYTNKKLGVTN